MHGHSNSCFIVHVKVHGLVPPGFQKSVGMHGRSSFRFRPVTVVMSGLRSGSPSVLLGTIHGLIFP